MEYSTLKMEIENTELSAKSEFELFSCVDINVDSSVYDLQYEIKYEDIVEKTESCIGISAEQRRNWINIIYKNRKVF